MEPQIKQRTRRALTQVGSQFTIPRSPSLSSDALAALVVTALMVPQALGYAALAGVPVQAGLYAIPLALLAYSLLGSSPQLVVGPVSTVSVLTGSIVASRGITDPAEALGLVTALTIISGVLLIIAGLVRIGWIAEFLSKPIITGFVFGLTIVILIGEFPVLLGLPRVRGTGLERIQEIVNGVDDLQSRTAILGIGSLVILFVGNKLVSTVPWGLVVVVFGLVISTGLDLAADGVAVIGSVPRGLPDLSVPNVGLSELSGLVVSGAALALVGLAESLSAARLFAVRNNYRIKADQELIATGAANVAAGFSGGLGVAGSLSKTATSDQSGGRSQVTGVISAGFVLLVLVLLASSLEALPRAVLSAIVIQAVWGLMDVDALSRYRRVRRNDFIAAMVALFGVLIFGTLYGLLLAVAMSVLGLVYRSGRVHVDVMGKVKDEKAAWGSIRKNHERTMIDGILVLRLSAPLFWVNAARATSLIMDEIDAAPATEALVLDLEATNQLDITGADELCALITRLHKRNVDVYLVRVMHPVRRVLRKTGVVEALGTGHMWRTISQGVKAAKHARKAS